MPDCMCACMCALFVLDVHFCFAVCGDTQFTKSWFACCTHVPVFQLYMPLPALRFYHCTPRVGSFVINGNSSLCFSSLIFTHLFSLHGFAQLRSTWFTLRPQGDHASSLCDNTHSHIALRGPPPTLRALPRPCIGGPHSAALTPTASAVWPA